LWKRFPQNENHIRIRTTQQEFLENEPDGDKKFPGFSLRVIWSPIDVIEESPKENQPDGLGRLVFEQGDFIAWDHAQVEHCLAELDIWLEVSGFDEQE
jgi:hypothetical protein